MVAIAISADPAMRRSLEQLLREDSTFSIVGAVDDPTAISLLIDQNHVNVVLADVPLRERSTPLKFHVAAILAKLNADSRTEAVARGAQLGLVML
jgi:DNA-binding NarL/FixJ family response regulator